MNKSLCFPTFIKRNNSFSFLFTSLEARLIQKSLPFRQEIALQKRSIFFPLTIGSVEQGGKRKWQRVACPNGYPFTFNKSDLYMLSLKLICTFTVYRSKQQFFICHIVEYETKHEILKSQYANRSFSVCSVLKI